MLETCLLSLVLLANATPPDAASLVARLASPSTTAADRDEASRALEALGRDALPSLVAGLETPDLEARRRILATWEQVQKALMVRPSLVQLDGKGKPIAEVVQGIGDQAGILVELSEQDREHLVHVREPRPIPFWEAMDRVGLNADRMITPGLGGPHFPTLSLSSKLDTYPTFTSGPFRFQLRGLHEQRDVTLIDGPWLRVDTIHQKIPVAPGALKREIRFYAELGLLVEPRMWLTQEGPARAIEAVDDLGQSLINKDLNKDATNSSFHGQSSGVTEGRIEVDLAMPTKPGRSIARLRGTVPVALQVRQPIWAFEIPLAEAKGKPFEHEGVTITVREFEDGEYGTNVSFDMKVDLTSLGVPADRAGEIASIRLNCLQSHQIDLVDAEGRVLPSAGGGGWGPDGTGQMSFSTSKNLNKQPPVKLRYYAMTRTFLDIPFAFEKIPML